jgi:spore germination protein GerM
VKRLVAMVAGLTACVVALAALSACGVSTDSEPHEISEANVPESDTPSQAPTTGQGGEETDVFFIRAENDDVRLVAQERTVRRPRTARGVLEALLLDGPDETERAFNITTAIPSSTTLASPPELTDDGVLVIDLTDGLFEVRGDELRNAYAQLVCTATELEEVEAVTFELDGGEIEALDGNGRSTTRPLRCADYAGLRPPDDSESS